MTVGRMFFVNRRPLANPDGSPSNPFLPNIRMLQLISYNVPVGVAVLGHPSIEFPKTFPQTP